MKQNFIIHIIGTLCLIFVIFFHIKDIRKNDNINSINSTNSTNQSIYSDPIFSIDNSKTSFSVSGSKFRAFDPTFEGKVYEISNAVAGEYQIPYSAIEKGKEIDVDNSVIFFVDELKADEFNNWYHNTELYNVLEIIRKLSEFEETYNCKIGFLISEGIGTEFSGDGTYTINLNQITKAE